MKRHILAVLSMFALVPGALRAQEAHAILFTEKELNAGGGRVTFSNDFYYCRVGIEYVAEKPLTLVVKPCHNAFMGLWRHTFPASAEPRSRTCDLSTLIMPDELEFSVECRGTNEVRSLVVESIPRNEYMPSTTIPNPLRKGAARHEQIKKAYAAAKPHPVILFGDSLNLSSDENHRLWHSPTSHVMEGKAAHIHDIRQYPFILVRQQATRRGGQWHLLF